LSSDQIQEILDTLAGLVEGGDEVKIVRPADSTEEEGVLGFKIEFPLEEFVPAAPKGKKIILLPPSGGAFH
jgi:hypothetical protein